MARRKRNFSGEEQRNKCKIEGEKLWSAARKRKGWLKENKGWKVL